MRGHRHSSSTAMSMDMSPCFVDLSSSTSLNTKSESFLNVIDSYLFTIQLYNYALYSLFGGLHFRRICLCL